MTKIIKKCKAKTEKGKPCRYEAVITGFCMMHFKVAQKAKDQKW